MLGFETALLYMIPQRNSIRLVTLVRNTVGFSTWMLQI